MTASKELLVLVGSFYPDQTGGPANTVYWMAKNLAGRGVRTTVVTSDRGLTPEFVRDTWTDTAFGRVIYLTTPNIYLPWRVIGTAIRQLRHFQTVYFTSVFYTLSLVLVPLAVLSGKKVVWSPCGELLSPALAYGKYRKKAVLRLVRLLARRVVFHATSDAELEAIRQVMGPKVRVVKLPWTMELPEQEPRMPEKYLLFVGRIHPIKGLENLLQALASSAVFRASDHYLKIVGDAGNEYGKTLASLAGDLGLQEKVQFTGRLEGVAKNRAFANARCTILPSFSENFGAVVVESLAQSTPVIASTGTPWELLETYGAGIRTGNDPESLGAAIDRFMLMPEDTYENCRRNAYRLVCERFGSGRNAADYENMLLGKIAPTGSAYEQ